MINESDKTAMFNVVIEDPDRNYSPNQQLELISNPSEWQYWCESDRKYPRPSEFQKIESNKLIMEPGERVTLLFKFLTFRKAEYDNSANPNAYKDDNYRAKYIG